MSSSSFLIRLHLSLSAKGINQDDSTSGAEFHQNKWLVRLKSFSSWKTLEMQFVVECTLSQHQHSGSTSTAPALSLIKDLRISKTNSFPTRAHAQSQTHNSCDLISQHIRGSTKSYFGTKFGQKKETNTERKEENAAHFFLGLATVRQ